MIVYFYCGREDVSFGCTLKLKRRITSTTGDVGEDCARIFNLIKVLPVVWFLSLESTFEFREHENKYLN